MNYSKHFNTINSLFQELDLLKENEFNLLKKGDFTFECISACIKLSEFISEKLKINLSFGVKYDYTFNAKAIVKDKQGVILLNLGLIEKLEQIVSNSVEIFSKENISSYTILETDKEELKILYLELCYSYIFYHELAHVIQMLNTLKDEKYSFQEQYSTKNVFNVKNHIYELDADLFGISISTVKLLEFISKKNYPINPILLLNILTGFLFTISNIIILFSENQFKNIYFSQYSHPHPLIRIFRCNEQILYLSSINLKINKELLFTVINRTNTIIDQIDYNKKNKINFSELIHNNINEIQKYIDEIDSLNDSYEELIRFKSQEIFNSSIIY